MLTLVGGALEPWGAPQDPLWSLANIKCVAAVILRGAAVILRGPASLLYSPTQLIISKQEFKQAIVLHSLHLTHRNRSGQPLPRSQGLFSFRDQVLTQGRNVKH